jgi:hypothetical protein
MEQKQYRSRTLFPEVLLETCLVAGNPKQIAPGIGSPMLPELPRTPTFEATPPQ